MYPPEPAGIAIMSLLREMDLLDPYAFPLSDYTTTGCTHVSKHETCNGEACGLPSIDACSYTPF